MSYRPFHPHENQFSPLPTAIVATPATAQENQSQLVATELRQSATVTAGMAGLAESVANYRRTVATGNADKMGTVATIATVASPSPENEKQDGLIERAGMLMDNGIPQEQADGLALALHLLQCHPKAEAALCWLIDNRNPKEEA